MTVIQINVVFLFTDGNVYEEDSQFPGTSKIVRKDCSSHSEDESDVDQQKVNVSEYQFI